MRVIPGKYIYPVKEQLGAISRAMVYEDSMHFMLQQVTTDELIYLHQRQKGRGRPLYIAYDSAKSRLLFHPVPKSRRVVRVVYQPPIREI